MGRFWGSGRHGLTQGYQPPVPGAVTLQIIGVSPNPVPEDAAAGTVVGLILNKTAGSTLTLTDDAGGRFAISGVNLVTGATPLDYETATNHNITFHEVLAGAANTPRDTAVNILVSDVADGGRTAPTLVQTSGATVNPLRWTATYPGATVWDGSNGDKADMQWRVNGGSWQAATRKVLDSDVFLTGTFDWTEYLAATFAGGDLVEVQERLIGFVGGAQVTISNWSTILSDTMAAVPFAFSQLFGGGDVGYAFDTTDLTKMWQSNGGSTAAAFGSVVGELVDISGKGNHFLSSANDTTRPTLQNVSNGLIQYDGSNDRLRLLSAPMAAAGAMTWMFAVRAPSSATAYYLWAETLSSNANEIYPIAHVTGDDLYALIVNTVGTAIANASLATNNFDDTLHIVTVTDTGSLITAYVGGVSMATLAYTRSGVINTCNETRFGASGKGGTIANFYPGYLGSGLVIGRVLGGPHATAGSELNKAYNKIATLHGLSTL